MQYEKKFLIIGNQNAICYKEIFPLIKSDNIWLGNNNGAQSFYVPDSYEQNNIAIEDGRKVAKFGNICWFTNLEHSKRHEPLILYKKYNMEEYPTYVNFDAINIDKIADIPEDYYGMMGVPITFMDKYCPDQFELIGFGLGLADMGVIKAELGKVTGGPRFYLREQEGNLKRLYERLVIKRKQ